MKGFEFWYNFFNLLIQSGLHVYFSGQFTGKKIKVRHFGLYFAFFYIVNTAVGNYNWGEAASAAFVSDLLNMAALVILCGVINHGMLGNDWFISCVASVLAVYVPQLCCGMMNAVETFIFPHVLGKVQMVYCIVTSSSLMALFLCLVFYKMILRCFSFREMKYPTYIWMLLPACIFFFAAEYYILWSAYTNVVVVPYTPENGKQMGLFLLQAAGLAALLSILYAYSYACRGLEDRLLVSSLTQEVRAQKSYVEEARIRYGKTRAFRHDIKNHLAVLAGLINSGDIGQAKEYLKKLRAVTEDLTFLCQTGNAVIDILLGDKLGLAEMKGIAQEVSVVFPEELKVDGLDLCVIFANAADNAIAACAEVKGPKYIRITGEQQGDFYMLEFENSCAPGPLPPYGTGLSNVKAAAEKYRGAITAEKTDTYFRLNVLLNIA